MHEPAPPPTVGPPRLRPPIPDDESGYSTAELLGNAALAVTALVGIWLLIEGLGSDVVSWISSQLGVG